MLATNRKMYEMSEQSEAWTRETCPGFHYKVTAGQPGARARGWQLRLPRMTRSAEYARASRIETIAGNRVSAKNTMDERHNGRQRRQSLSVVKIPKIGAEAQIFPSVISLSALAL